MHTLFYSILAGSGLAMLTQSMLTIRSYRSRFALTHWMAAPVLFPLLAVLYTIIVWSILPTIAYPSESCPTLSEARKQWPEIHLRYRIQNGNKCWGNYQRVVEPDAKPQAKKPRHVAYSVNRNPLRLPKPPVDANGSMTHHSGKPLIVTVSENEYNELDAQANNGLSIFYPALIPSEPMLIIEPKAMTGWPVLIDIDVQQVFTPWEFRIAGAFER